MTIKYLQNILMGGIYYWTLGPKHDYRCHSERSEEPFHNTVNNLSSLCYGKTLRMAQGDICSHVWTSWPVA